MSYLMGENLKRRAVSVGCDELRTVAPQLRPDDLRRSAASRPKQGCDEPTLGSASPHASNRALTTTGLPMLASIDVRDSRSISPLVPSLLFRGIAAWNLFAEARS